jgi:hypothetical protein
MPPAPAQMVRWGTILALIETVAINDVPPNPEGAAAILPARR